MTVNIQGFNVGTDVSFVVTDSLGDIFIDGDMGYLEDFNTRAMARAVKITPITTGGIPVHQTLWNGGNGRLSFTRFGPSFQQIWMDLASAYHGAGIIPQFYINVNVRNRDGSVDQYAYSGVQFTDPDFGNYQATREVRMQVGFDWSLCEGTGALQAFLAAVALVA